MQQKIINMLEVSGKELIPSDSHLSFKPFVEFLRKNLQNKDSVKNELLAFVLNKFESFENIDATISLNDLPKYKELLDLLYVVLTNVTEDEKQIYWGLSVPISPVMFYGSDFFYQLLAAANAHDNEMGLDDEDYIEFLHSRLEYVYRSILKQFYNFDLTQKRKLIRNIKKGQADITRHFSINLNTDFVEILAKEQLPKIEIEQLLKLALADDVIDQLQKLLPLNNFSYTGFTILTVADVTHEYALDTIKNSIVKNQVHSDNYEFPEVVKALKELTGSSAIEFNLLPLFRINGKLVEDMKTYTRSILFSSAQKKSLTDKICIYMIEKSLLSPELFYYNDLDIEVPSNADAAKILQEEGLKSYCLFPIFYNKKLVGAVEAYSREKGLMSEKMLSLMESARDLLAQLMYNSLAMLETEIDMVIKEKYTRLQPSVEWKFIDVAWRYLQHTKDINNSPDSFLEEIAFDQVYPLYGAVDIRNSTIERNIAMLKDNNIQFEVLLDVLKTLKEKTSFGLLDEKIYASTKWLNMISGHDQNFNQQVKLNDFLEHKILQFLQEFTENNPELKRIATPYFEAIDEKLGIAYEHRRKLESSMTKVISSVNNYFGQLKNEIQKAYPCYFEKFRTDGVEYDIYIGQSISPDTPYSDIYLKNLRLMQLTSMASITRDTHALLPQLSNPVETTQLIFIHSQPIDILFRNDEKRFDVEGAYNIRYHIIKKRIDKVHLKNSDERLTQPSKIALVYFSEKEASEYISYIKYLQSDNILNDDMEKLELEELSGVSGLKALRVGVNLLHTDA
jgi:hypothetical protein